MSDEPTDDFEGLSPSQMHEIIYSPYLERDYVSFNRRIDIDRILSESPIYQLAIQYLRLIADQREIRLTATGRLPQKHLNYLYSLKILPDHAVENGITKLTSQSDWVAFYSLFFVAELAGLTKKRNKKLSLTQKGEKLLQTAESENSLFFLLLETYSTKYNMGCFDGYEDDGCGQIGFLFALWLLIRYGNSSRDCSFYSAKYFRAYPHLLKYSDDSKAHHCFAVRFFSRFCDGPCQQSCRYS